MWWKRLKEAMDAEGLSPQDLADRVNVSRERIYDYLKGKTENPRGDMMEKLAEAVGLDVEYLHRGTPPANGSLSSVAVPNPDRCFGVSIADTANNPEVGERDILVFDCDAAPEPGSYVLAVLTDSETAYIGRLKPLIHNNLSEFIIRFANTDYPDITVNADEPGKIIARAIGKYSPL